MNACKKLTDVAWRALTLLDPQSSAADLRLACACVRIELQAALALTDAPKAPKKASKRAKNFNVGAIPGSVYDAPHGNGNSGALRAEGATREGGEGTC